MFRRWLSSFFKRNKRIIIEIAKKLGILILIAATATAIMSVLNKNQSSTKTEDSISIYNPTKTVVEGKKVTSTEYSEDSEIITKFVSYCNNKDLENAYGLLSDECKTELYSTLESFRDNYYKEIFKSKKEFNLQSWINYQDRHTYKVNFNEDFLSTGDYDNSSKTQDYITVFLQDNEKKINLNGYINKIELKKEYSYDFAKVLVEDKKVYMDCEEYTIKIKNINKTSILLDTGKSVSTIKLINENNVDFYSYFDKIVNLKNPISPGSIRTLKIRFNKTFSVDDKDKYIVFSDIVTDANKYNQNNEYKERETIKIEL